MDDRERDGACMSMVMGRTVAGLWHRQLPMTHVCRAANRHVAGYGLGLEKATAT
jgi:hypothetical protein